MPTALIPVRDRSARIESADDLHVLCDVPVEGGHEILHLRDARNDAIFMVETTNPARASRCNVRIMIPGYPQDPTRSGVLRPAQVGSQVAGGFRISCSKAPP